MRNGDTRMVNRSKYVILDKPLMEYASLLFVLISQHEYIHVDFLCSCIPKSSHFSCILAECSYSKLTYRCLNIPIHEWEEWKKRTEYQGQ